MAATTKSGLQVDDDDGGHDDDDDDDNEGGSTRLHLAAPYEYLRWFEVKSPVVPSVGIPPAAEVSYFSANAGQDFLVAPRVRVAPKEDFVLYHPPPTTAAAEYGDGGVATVQVGLSADEKAVFERQSKAENYEDAITLNLSYQDLGTPYQVLNFRRILGRLTSVVELNLSDNFMTSLKGFTFPKLKILTLSRNNLSRCDRDLPSAPVLQKLNLSENNIKSVKGLGKYRELTVLTLKLNEVALLTDYRKRVAKECRSLLVLDGVALTQYNV